MHSPFRSRSSSARLRRANTPAQVGERRKRSIGLIPSSWAAVLGHASSQELLAAIADFIADEGDAGRRVLPSGDLVFAALRATPYNSVRAVILGQDPYPTRSHAMGLAFSVPRTLPPPLPRSLVQIRAELRSDGGWAVPQHGSLEAWTRNGVLLLNTTLTVEEGRAGATRHRAVWSKLTEAILSAVAAKDQPVAFLLWGRHAQAKAALIAATQHVVVCAPSPP
jgi:uracil-DNA glycosylase